MGADMAKRDLTPKQIAFALAYFETGNASEAYRQAYNVDPNSRDSWIAVEACLLLDNPKISLMLDDLQKQAAQISIYTRQKAMEELEGARSKAEAEKQVSAMVSAINSKIKLTGLDRPYRVELTGKDGGPIQQEVSPREIIASRLAGLASRGRETDGTGGAD